MRYFLLFCFNLCAAIHCTNEIPQPICAKRSFACISSDFSKKITDMPYRLRHYLAQLKGIQLLLEKLQTTSTLDIGGIREPLAMSIYSMSNPSHVTINADKNSLPDFCYKYGLDFAGFLQCYPEVPGIITQRTKPLNCLVSHVGDYIFEDAFRKETTTLGFFKSAPILMNTTCSIRFSALYGFIDGMCAYLCLLKGGTFTYKSFKHIFGTINPSVFAMEAAEDYSCFWMNSNKKVQARTFQQRILRFSTNGGRITAFKTSGKELNLEAIWPLVGFSHRIFADVLGISNVQTTMNALDEFTLFHTIQFLVPSDYVIPEGIAGRLERLLNAYDTAC